MTKVKATLDFKQFLLYLIAIPGLFVVALRGLGGITRSIAPDLPIDIRTIIVELLITIPIFLVFRKVILQGEKHFLTKLRFFFCFLYLGIPFLIHAGMNIWGHEIKSGFGNILLAVLAAFTVGLCEELIFRGVIFNKLQVILSGRKNVFLISALVSSCVFGLIHYENLLEQTFIGTTMQVYFAFGMGLYFCGVYLFAGTLLIPILLHGIVDAGVFLLVSNDTVTATSFNWFYMGLSTAILIIGLILLIVYGRKGPFIKNLSFTIDSDLF